jgi:hypothetical protein
MASCRLERGYLDSEWSQYMAQKSDPHALPYAEGVSPHPRRCQRSGLWISYLLRVHVVWMRRTTTTAEDTECVGRRRPRCFFSVRATPQEV